MKNAFYMIIMKFGENVGMSVQFDGAALGISIAIVVMAFLLCFFGIKLFRIFSSVMMYVMVALFFLFAMKRADMGEIVTAFTVVGLIMAAITFRWYRLSAFIIAGFIGFSIAVPLVESFWINMAIGAAFGIVVNVFPVMAIMTLTATWGAIHFTISSLDMLNINLPGYLAIPISILVAFAGIIVQYFFSKELLKLPWKQRRVAALK